MRRLLKTDNQRRSASAHLVAIGAVMVAPLSGCVSLDAKDDLARSAAISSQRTGVAADWHHPWDEPHAAWDGESPLSADAAVQVALHNNRALRQRVEQIAAARADYAQAHLPPNPVINLAAGATLDSLGGSPLTIALMQQLAWLWQRGEAIDASNAQRLAAIYTTGDLAIELASGVRSAHAAVVYTGQAATLREDDLASTQRIEQALRELFLAGEASEIELNRASIDVHTARAALTSAQAAHDQAKRQLLELLGRPEHHTRWSAVAPEDERDLPTDEMTLVQDAVAHRLDIQAAAAREDALAAHLGLAERRRLPDIAVGLAYQQNFSDRPAAIPSLSITPKILDDGSPALARAQSEYRQAEMETNRILQRAITQTREAYIAFHEAHANATRFAEHIVKLAEHNADAAERAFEAGVMDISAALETQRKVYAARLQLNALQLDRRQALYALERAVGRTLRSHTQVAAREVTVPRGGSS